MASQDYWEFTDDFSGPGLNTTKWEATEISTLGALTLAMVSPGQGGGYSMAFDTQAEAQSYRLDWDDALGLDIDKIREVNIRIKGNQAAGDAASDTEVVWGLASAANIDPDALTEAAIFRVDGAADVNAINIETDDGTNDESTASGVDLAAAFLDCKISFALGTDDVRFFINGTPVATGTTFDMSNYT